MTRLYKHFCTSILLASVYATFVVPAFSSHVSQVTATITSLPEGTYLYYFTVINSTSSVDSILSFGLLNITPVVTTASIETPAGWALDLTSTSVIWTSLDPSFDIGPGAQTVGFSFEALTEPATVQYFTLGIDETTGDTTGLSRGSVAGPAAVPEASTYIAGVAGLLLCLLKRHGRKGSRQPRAA
jgi:hypothetical protein